MIDFNELYAKFGAEITIRILVPRAEKNKEEIPEDTKNKQIDFVPIKEALVSSNINVSFAKKEPPAANAPFPEKKEADLSALREKVKAKGLELMSRQENGKALLKQQLAFIGKKSTQECNEEELFNLCLFIHSALGEPQ